MFTEDELEELENAAVAAALKAGKLIQQASLGEVSVSTKDAGSTRASSVVTEVDIKSQSEILDTLAWTIDGYDLAVLSEELPDDGSRFEKRAFWCIDPIDGTLPFIENRPGYSVSIALVSREGESLIGVVYDPRQAMLYQARKGSPTLRNGSALSVISREKAVDTALTVYVDLGSRDHPSYHELLRVLEAAASVAGVKRVEVVDAGGAALAGCWILESAPACFIKLPKDKPGCGSSWDYAALSCLMPQGGGYCFDVFGDALDLNPKGSLYMNQKGIALASHLWVVEALRGFLKGV